MAVLRPSEMETAILLGMHYILVIYLLPLVIMNTVLIWMKRKGKELKTKQEPIFI